MNAFRSIGSITRKSTTNQNRLTASYGLNDNLYLYLIRICENEGITQSELAEILNIDKTTMSRAVKKLEQKEFIRKVNDPDNQRRKLLFPTEKGKRIYPTLASFEQKQIDEALKGLTQKEIQQLEKTLTKIVDNMR